MAFTLRSVEELMKECYATTFRGEEPSVERKEGKDWAYTKIVRLEDVDQDSNRFHNVHYFIDMKDGRYSFDFQTSNLEDLEKCDTFSWTCGRGEDGEPYLEFVKDEDSEHYTITWKIFKGNPRIEVEGPSDFSFAIPQEVADAFFEDILKEDTLE